MAPLQNKVDMTGYKPSELVFPSGRYLVQLSNIEDKQIANNNAQKNNGQPWNIWELTHKVLNGVDERGRQKVVTLNKAIFLGSEYTQDEVYRVFTAFGLAGNQLNNPELAIGQYAIVDYTNKEDAVAQGGKPYAKFKYSKYKQGQQVPPIRIVGQVKQPTMQQPQVAHPALPVGQTQQFQQPPLQGQQPQQPGQPIIATPGNPWGNPQ